MSSVRKTMLRAAGFNVEVTRKQQKHMYVRLKPCAGGADATGGSSDARFRVCVSAPLRYSDARFFLLPSSVIANPRNAVDRRDFALDALSRKAPALHTDGGARWVFRVDQLRSASLLEGVFGAVHRRFSVCLLAVGWVRSYSPCRRIY